MEKFDVMSFYGHENEELQKKYERMFSNMTQEEKQLLLKDLCARLPYGVKIKYLYWDEDKGCEYPVPMILDDINSDGYIRFHGDIKEEEGRGYILTYLPYLRPMSSMTDEEREEFHIVGGVMSYNVQNDTWAISAFTPEAYDWLNAHYFDYHIVPSTGKTMIESNLALEAPKDMYKTE